MNPEINALVDFLKTTDIFAEAPGELLAAIADNLEIVALTQGDHILTEGDASEALYIIKEGTVAISALRSGHRVILTTQGPGESFGEGALLGEQTCSASVSADTNVKLLRLDRTDCQHFIFNNETQHIHTIVDSLAKRIQRSRRESVLCSSDLFASLSEQIKKVLVEEVEMVSLLGGQALFKTGDPPTHLYILLSGRLRLYGRNEKGDRRRLKDIAPGGSVGEMGLILEEPRTLDVIASRDSIIAKLSHESYRRILKNYPEEISRLFTKTVANHLRVKARYNPATAFALIPLSDSLPMEKIGSCLSNALEPTGGKAVVISSKRLCRELGDACFAESESGDPRLTVLQETLQRYESNFRYALYMADHGMTGWSRRCLNQSDHILALIDATKPLAPETLNALKTLRSNQNDTPVTAVLVRRSSEKPVVPTANILDNAPDYKAYHLKYDLQSYYDRFARILTGQAIGYVFSGGGARSFAHIGIVKALKEAGIPIDMFGGNSMGSIILAQLAMEKSFSEIMEDTVRLSKAGDRPTLPLVSFFGGHKLRRALQKLFGDLRIEDLAIPNFVVSCNLSRSRLETHDRGLVWKYVLASCTPVGLLPPVISNGDLYVDGGVLNNLPADVMRRRIGTGVVIATDAHRRDIMMVDDSVTNLGPVEMILSRLFPKRKKYRAPSIIDIVTRSGQTGGLAGINKAKGFADIFLQPSVTYIPMLAYSRGYEAMEVGYRYALEQLEGGAVTELEALRKRFSV